MPPNTERSSRNLDHGRQGFVYVLSSKHLRAEDRDGAPLLKVGCTRKHPLQRAKELAASSGVPDAFRVEYYRDFVDCFLAESMTHDHFADRRLNDQREFFAVPLPEVVAFLDALSSSVGYRDLASEGVTGGDFVKPIRLPDLSYAELFATFPDDGSPRGLSPDERAACARLAASKGAR